MMFVFAMGESIENIKIFKKVVENKEGGKSRISVFIIRALIILISLSLTVLSNDLVTILEFSGTNFCSFVNYIIPVRFQYSF